MAHPPKPPQIPTIIEAASGERQAKKRTKKAPQPTTHQVVQPHPKQATPKQATKKRNRQAQQPVIELATIETSAPAPKRIRQEQQQARELDKVEALVAAPNRIRQKQQQARELGKAALAAAPKRIRQEQQRARELAKAEASAGGPFVTEETSRRDNACQRLPALARRDEPSVRAVVEADHCHTHRRLCTLGVFRNANGSPAEAASKPRAWTPRPPAQITSARPAEAASKPRAWTPHPPAKNKPAAISCITLFLAIFCATTTSAQQQQLTDVENLIYFPTRSGRPAPDLQSTPEAKKAEQQITERKQQVKQHRAEAITRLKSFVDQEPETAPEMPDALMRLAELTWENSRAVYLEDYEAWQKTNTKARSAEPPLPDSSEALALYDRILTKHKDFDRTDLVLYMKAYALMEAGRMTDALTQYQRILDEYPNSRFRPDAHMAFAESYFNGNHDFAAALKRYEEVLKYPDSELADLALFKSAWC
ncbi:MAG TPA: tetratricopeptide repeat protein, partial [Polyangiales bacterium]|nr:tetratricopeptide repeat protein [Polyangiales bacterium]